MARLAVFSLVDWSFSTVRSWADAAGHEIALLVTLPPSERLPGLRHAPVDAGTAVMVVPQASGCEAALASLEVDLAIVFTFLRIPESVATLPRHGTVNVHPSLLPAYRGANGYRSLYQGEPQLGATLHVLTPEFDSGPILAQAAVLTPEDVEPDSAREALVRAATAVLEAGVPRALAAERGEQQDESAATDAPRFSEAEAVLDLGIARRLFQCRLSALSLAGIQPWVMLEGERQPLLGARALPGLTAAAPGVFTLSSRRAVVAVADGVLELDLGKVPF